MFKHLILVFSLLGIVSCSENYVDKTSANNLSVASVSDFKLASISSVATVEAVPDELHFIRSEAIGGLRLDMTPNQFATLLPCKVTKGEPTLWAGIGEIIQEWSYAECGIKLQLSSPDNNSPQTISSIKVSTPSESKTSRGIGIGSDFNQVLEAYSEFADNDGNQTGESFIAGSIYGGLFIQFQDNLVTSASSILKIRSG